MVAFKSSLQSEERFNESREDNDFFLVVWAFCLTPGASPSVICPLIRSRCCVIVWEMKKPFWSEWFFERSSRFCEVALIVKAPGVTRGQGNYDYTEASALIHQASYSPSDPSVKRARFGWWWNSSALQTNTNVLLTNVYRCCSVQEVLLDKMEVIFQRVPLILNRVSQTLQKCNLKHFFTRDWVAQVSNRLDGRT